MALRTPHYRNLLDVARLLHTKKISPVELTKQMLQRIDVKDRKLRSYATVTPELAVKQAKKAELIYQREQATNDLSLLNITLITGRPHQIRVQLSNLGYPVYGDKKYGAKNGGLIMLHASQLTFTHPTLKKEMSIHSNLPNGFPWDYFNNSDNS